MSAVVAARRGLRTLRRSPAGPTLLLLPHAGGNPGAFTGWAAELPADTTVMAACYPGRLERLTEDPLTTVRELAADVAESVDDDTEGLIIFGHSLGSYVGAELCEILQRQGQPPRLLIASGSKAPHRSTPRGIVQGGPPSVINDVIRLNPKARTVFDDVDLCDLVMPALMGDYTAVEHYARAAAPQLTSDIVTFCGTNDPLVTPEQNMAWQECTTGTFTQVRFNGDHFFTEAQRTEVLHELARLVSRHR